MEKEMLFHKNDLSTYLNDLGHNDFETYESSEQQTSYESKTVLGQQSKDLKSTILNQTPIKLCDHKKIMILLNSKLLFLEDVQFVERILSFCYISNDSFKNYMLGAVATSVVSMAACFNRGLDLYLPLGCVALSSVYAALKLYQGLSEVNSNKQFALYVETLQKMCTLFHKLLRFIKEVEILSTGQVSSENVGSAMYKPLNSVGVLNDLEPWKTLPDLRKYVADSLIDVITVFSRNFNDLKKYMQPWMDIKDFSLSSHVLIKQMESVAESIKGFEGCISMKDLVVLNDNYLLIQSEFLKWVAFYLCPVVWKDSSITYSSYKNEIIRSFKSTTSKFTDICLKLQLSFDLGQLFNCPQTNHPVKINSESNTSKEELKDFKNLQAQLHNIFLLVLSTVQKSKDLEEYLESFASKSNGVNLRENLTQQLSSVRNDLEQVLQNYDYIYNLLLEKKKIDHKYENEETENIAASSSRPYQLHDSIEETRTGVGYSDFAVSSPDEVFLAISGLKPDDFEFDSNDWCLEKKPKIPSGLLLELSSTLKPIREDFEARERIAMERQGVEDIKISENEDGEDEQLIYNQNNPLKLKKGIQNQLNLCNSEIQTENVSNLKHENSVKNESMSSSSSMRIADLLLTSSLVQQRKVLEDCFSND